MLVNSLTAEFVIEQTAALGTTAILLFVSYNEGG